MRIRSIKPEFWRSDDIDALALADRLLFIGLWSYVDDNGVGRDRAADVAGDLFSGDLSRDPRETLERVSEGLSRLSEAGLISRYTVADRSYLHVSSWADHQRIDKPARSRKPLPTCGDAVPRETLATPSRDPIDNSRYGAVEPGTYGTGEQEEHAPAGAADLVVIDAEIIEPERARNAGTLIAEWIDHCENKPVQRVIGQVAKHLKTLLDEGHPYEAVRLGLAEWHTRAPGTPSQLPNFVNEVLNPPTRPRWAADRGGKQTPTERAADVARMAAELQAEHDARQTRLGA